MFTQCCTAQLQSLHCVVATERTSYKLLAYVTYVSVVVIAHCCGCGSVPLVSTRLPSRTLHLLWISHAHRFFLVLALFR